MGVVCLQRRKIQLWQSLFLVFVANQHYKSLYKSDYGWVDYRWYGVQEIKVLGRSLI